jgi:predicted metal-dependent phosphoesterase TrpH
MKKGVFHVHSVRSFDGLNSFSALTRFVKKHKLDFIILTDHDTIEGSLQMKRMLSKSDINIEVPLAAEYRTNKGDVIAAYISQEIVSRSWSEFVAEVRSQDGVLVLPHPYDSHQDVELLASEVDAIEVFNSRSSVKNNYKSYLLAKKFNKPMLWASDSHIPFTLRNVIIGYDDVFSFRHAISNHSFFPVVCKPSTYLDVFLSQMKKVITSRNLNLFFSIIYSLLVRILRLLFNRKKLF